MPMKSVDVTLQQQTNACTLISVGVVQVILDMPPVNTSDDVAEIIHGIQENALSAYETKYRKEPGNSGSGVTHDAAYTHFARFLRRERHVVLKPPTQELDVAMVMEQWVIFLRECNGDVDSAMMQFMTLDEATFESIQDSVKATGQEIDWSNLETQLKEIAKNSRARTAPGVSIRDQVSEQLHALEKASSSAGITIQIGPHTYSLTKKDAIYYFYDSETGRLEYTDKFTEIQEHVLGKVNRNSTEKVTVSMFLSKKPQVPNPAHQGKLPIHSEKMTIDNTCFQNEIASIRERQKTVVRQLALFKRTDPKYSQKLTQDTDKLNSALNQYLDFMDRVCRKETHFSEKSFQTCLDSCTNNLIGVLPKDDALTGDIANIRGYFKQALRAKQPSSQPAVTPVRMQAPPPGLNWPQHMRDNLTQFAAYWDEKSSSFVEYNTATAERMLELVELIEAKLQKKDITDEQRLTIIHDALIKASQDPNIKNNVDLMDDLKNCVLNLRHFAPEFNLQIPGATHAAAPTTTPNPSKDDPPESPRP